MKTTLKNEGGKLLFIEEGLRAEFEILHGVVETGGNHQRENLPNVAGEARRSGHRGVC